MDYQLSQQTTKSLIILPVGSALGVEVSNYSMRVCNLQKPHRCSVFMPLLFYTPCADSCLHTGVHEILHTGVHGICTRCASVSLFAHGCVFFRLIAKVF